MHIHTAV